MEKQEELLGIDETDKQIEVHFDDDKIAWYDYSNLDELRDLSLLIAIYLLGQYTTNENIMRNVRNELNKEG